MTRGRPARKIPGVSRRNPFSRPIDYEAAIASDLREIAWAEARIRTAATISPEERAACPLGVGVDLMWYLYPEATREARWRSLSGTGLDVLAVVCAFADWDWPGLPEVDTCGRLAESEAAWDAAATVFAGHKGAAGDFIRPLEEERAELARLRARLARHRRNRETYGRRER